MSDQDSGRFPPCGGFASLPPRPPREPAFNLPPFVVIFAGLLVLIHFVRMLLSDEMDLWVIFVLAFIPARYGELAAGLPIPAAAIWSPLSYSFLHGSWTHLLINLFWLVAFASPVANRVGTWRAAAIATIASLGGALAHFLSYPVEMVPMIGASAIVSGFMGAAARFAFSAPVGARLNVHGPSRSLVVSFYNPRFLAFLLV